MVAVTLSSTTLTSRAALTRPKSTKRHARLAVRVHAKLETENDTADKEGVADATEKGGFLSGVNNVIKSIWPGSDVANAFNDFGNAKSNPAAKMFDADTMSEAERDALKRQYSQPTGLLAALFPVRCEFSLLRHFFHESRNQKKPTTKRNEFCSPAASLTSLTPLLHPLIEPSTHREPHDGLDGIGGNVLEDPTDPSSAQASTPFHKMVSLF